MRIWTKATLLYLYSWTLLCSKAFDCIYHSLLCDKLQRYGVRGVPFDWFKSYESERSQYVSTDSNIMNITHAVPQESV